MSTETHELNIPDIGENRHSIFKPCCMTVMFHDYAFPPSAKVDCLFFTMEGKPKSPIPLQIYSNWTLQLVRGLSNEQIGRLVRETLNKLEEEKKKIENQ